MLKRKNTTIPWYMDPWVWVKAMVFVIFILFLIWLEKEDEEILILLSALVVMSL